MEGLFPIISMPFDKKGNIDLEDLEAEVEYGISNGVDGIGVAFGSEINKLTDQERQIVTKTIVNQNQGRVPVVINTGASSTFASVLYSKLAQEGGADAIMCLPPSNLSDEIIIKYFLEIDSNVNIPVFIQDAGPYPIPEIVGKELSERSKNISYAKIETSPPPIKVKKWIETCGDSISIFGGASGVHILQELMYGSKGTMPHFAFIPMFRKVIDLFKTNDLTGAQVEFDRYKSIFNCELPQIFMTKEILKRAGVFKHVYLRDPVIFPTSESWKNFIQHYELLA